MKAEATDWHVLLRGGDVTPAQRDEFEAWLARDPRNRADFEAVLDAWRGADALAQDPDMLAWRGAALAQVSAPVPWRRRTAMAGLAVVALLGLGAAGTVALRQAHTVELATGLGEARTLSLPDGSLVELDADSAVEVRMSLLAREVRLVRGRAFFQVTHERWRGFRVDAGSVATEVLGTEFTVSSLDDQVAVNVVRGTVRVEDQGGAWRERLQAGQRVAFDPATGKRQRGSGDVAREVAWRQGRLEVENATLSSVARAFRRYSPVEISIEDERTGALLVTGRFDLRDPGAFVDAIVRLRPVRVAERTAERIRLAAKDAAAKDVSVKDGPARK